MNNTLGQCVVFGGGGFLGRALTNRLLDMGVKTRVFGRHIYPDLAEAGAECVAGDILDFQSVLQACRNCGTVFHTAAICGIERGWKPYYDVNVRGTANVLRACLEAKVLRLVYTSSPSVVVGKEDIFNGNEDLPYAAKYNSPYPATKAQAERLVLASNSWETVPNTEKEDNPHLGEGNVRHLLTCAIRPHLIWGENDPHILPVILKQSSDKRLRIVGPGTNVVSITHVENAAYAHILAAQELAGQAKNAGKAYFVNDTEPIILWKWIDDLLKRLGRPPITKHISHGMAWTIAAAIEAACNCFPFLGKPKVTRFIVEQLYHSHSFSHARATRDFGYKPIVSPQEGLDRLADALLLKNK